MVDFIRFLRTIGFCTFAILFTFSSVILFPIFILRRSWFIKYCHINLSVLTYACRFISGIKWKIEGAENIPNEPFVLAVKHLSAWETMFFAHYFKIPVYVFKKELLYIPVFGLYMKFSGMLAIKRGGGLKTITEMTQKAIDVIKNQKRILIIFPQGTRTPVNANTKKYPYKKGIVSIASALPNTPVLLATHDAVKFFGRNFFSLKKEGTVTIKFLPSIKKQKTDGTIFLEQIKDAIETETKKLL